jgi:hypothetical protein
MTSIPHTEVTGSEALPAPSAEAVLIGVAMRVYLRKLPRRERVRFVDDMTDTIDALASVGAVVGIRSPERSRQTARALREARAWWREVKGMIEPG